MKYWRRCKKRKKRPLIKILEKKADAALSAYTRAYTIKLYGLCPFCGINPIQACFHFITRKRKILRWEFTNVIGSCFTCNFIEQHWPDLSRAWFIRKFGVDVYLNLVDTSKQAFTPTIEYLEGKIKEYQEALKGLNGKA